MSEALRKAARELGARITEHMTTGGLFNPELAEHAKVRDLLLDCRRFVDDALAAPEPAEPTQEQMRARLKEYEDNIKYLLDSFPGSVRERYKYGEENLLGSLCITFIKLRDGDYAAGRASKEPAK